jgi:hypothetical protein
MNNPAPKPRRRWYQFSLRTLLIVVTLSALPLGWVGSKLVQRRREQPVIAWVEKLGGTVSFEDVEDLNWWEGAAAWFGQNVKWVHLAHAQVSDLSPLAELKNLELLDLNRPQTTSRVTNTE